MKTKADAYAASLLELARAEGITEKIDHDFALIAETVSGNLKLKETLKDAKIDASRKQAVIDDREFVADPMYDERRTPYVWKHRSNVGRSDQAGGLLQAARAR